MSTATTPSPPFASAQEFFDECNLHEVFGNWAADVRRRSAMAVAGFHMERCEHIPEHCLTVLAGSCQMLDELRTTRRIKKAILRSFRHEGFSVRGDMVAIYRGRTRVQVHVAILEHV
jgi:hypothetical protein